MVQFNTQWLAEWVDSKTLDWESVHTSLVSQGLENELLSSYLSDTIVVGEILRCEPHPKSSKLAITTVAVGGAAPLTIVCGCPTVRQARKVCVALVGTQLGTIQIADRMICGQSSSGMLCSLSELGLGGAASSGICHLADDAPVGASVSSWLRSGSERLDIEVTMNRGDCMSVRGVAREIAVGQGCVMQEPWSCGVDSLQSLPKADLAVRIDSDAHEVCQSLHIVQVEGLDLTRSTPDWMRVRLRESGIGLHNICVDILHYVMLETGQPFHAYDCAAVSGDVRVGYAKKDQVIHSLMGDDLVLDAKTLVVADEVSPRCIAGYMGDKNSSVS